MKRYNFASKKDDSTTWYRRRLEWLCSRADWSQRESGASARITNTPSVRHSRNFNRHNCCFWRYVTREYASSLPDSSECVISVADCPCWCVVLLFAVQTKVESTVKLLTAISRRLFWGCGAGSLTNRFMDCQSLPMVVVRGNTTSIGKRSVCSTGALRASLIFSSCIFSSISWCVLEKCYYLCIGSFLVRGLDPTFRQSWLFQVCLSYFKAFSCNFVVSVGFVHSINDHHYSF